MIISKEQMESLAVARQGAYLGRVREFITRNTQRAPDEATTAWLFQRGQGFGLRSERQLAGYILLAWACGCKPPDVHEPEWMSAVLLDAYRTPDDKLEGLFVLAEQRERAAA